VFFGSTDPARGVAITSTTTKLDSLVPGVTIDLKNASASAVRVSVTRDDGAVTEKVRKFVTEFNALIDTLNTYDKYDQEKEQRGLLLGDATIARVRTAMYRIVSGRISDVSGQYNSLIQVGVKVGAGAKLELDDSKFNAALQADRSAVEQLFTLRVTEEDDEGNKVVTASGFGTRVGELLTTLGDSVSGVVKTRLDSLADQVELNTERIATFDRQLAAKRQRLELQFAAMERALSQLQSQGNALSSFQPLSVGSGSTGS
jgi:flagellar hook-associated protein 2